MKPHIWFERGWWRCALVLRLAGGDTTSGPLGTGETPRGAFFNWRSLGT